MPAPAEAVTFVLTGQVMLTGEKRGQAAEALAYLLDRRRDLLAGSEALLRSVDDPRLRGDVFSRRR